MQYLEVFMGDEETLTSVRSASTGTVIPDFAPRGILDHLLESVVEMLPIDSAAVSLLSAATAPHCIAASDMFALRMEHIQTEARHGPSVSAFETGVAVAISDLRLDDHYPLFGPAAIEAGLAAMFTFPLLHAGGCLGALDLYRRTAGGLDPRDMTVAHALSDVVAAYVLHAQRTYPCAAAPRLQPSSLHDPLTGLPNRLLLNERLEHSGRRARRSRSSTAVVCVVLDQFEQFNDTHGHDAGDALLVAVTSRLAGLMRGGDTLARISSDEFVFLCESLADVADVEVLARRIHQSLDKSFEIAGESFSITASLSIAFAGPGEEVSDQLLVNAEHSMREIRRNSGAGHRTLDLRGAVLSTSRAKLRAEFKAAFAAGDLELAYQPIIRLSDGSISGVEALLRWNHPVSGSIPALTMIRIAEQDDLVDAVGLWVLETACRDRNRWLDGGAAVVPDLFVNISVHQLRDPAFPTYVAEVLTRNHTDPGALVLEVTESILVENFRECTVVLDRLRAMGLRVALDDFGTGYSSLSYLDHLPIDILKIDQSFVTRVGRAKSSLTILACIIRLAHDLGITVIAEGVETRYQRDRVAGLDCDHVQGYFHSRPMRSAAIARYLARRQLVATTRGSPVEVLL